MFFNKKINFSNIVNIGNFRRNRYKLGKWYALVVFSIFPALIFLSSVIGFGYYIQGHEKYDLDLFMLTFSGFLLFALDTAWAYRVNLWAIEYTDSSIIKS